MLKRENPVLARRAAKSACQRGLISVERYKEIVAEIDAVQAERAKADRSRTDKSRARLLAHASDAS